MTQSLVRKISPMSEICPMGTFDASRIMRGPVFLISYFVMPKLISFRVVYTIVAMVDFRLAGWCLQTVKSWADGTPHVGVWLAFCALALQSVIYWLDALYAQNVPCVELEAWKPTVGNLLANLNELEANPVATFVCGLFDLWLITSFDAFIFTVTAPFWSPFLERVSPEPLFSCLHTFLAIVCGELMFFLVSRAY